MAQKFFSIKNCEFAFRCPRDWERLATTENDNERYCASCEKPVYLCADDEALTEHVQAGHCVAVGDMAEVGGLFVGKVDSEYSARPQGPENHSASTSQPLPPTKQNTSSVSEMLTNSEIEQLRQKAKEADAYFQKAFEQTKERKMPSVNTCPTTETSSNSVPTSPSKPASPFLQIPSAEYPCLTMWRLEKLRRRSAKELSDTKLIHQF